MSEAEQIIAIALTVFVACFLACVLALWVMVPSGTRVPTSQTKGLPTLDYTNHKYQQPCDRCHRWKPYLTRVLAIDTRPEPTTKPSHQWWCFDCVGAMVSFSVLD